MDDERRERANARQRAWRAKNKDRINAERRASGYDRQWYDKNRQSVRQRQQQYEDQRKYERYKLNAEARGIPFDLDQDLFISLTNSPCVYCGSEPPSGIDRVDNSLPYAESNVVSSCTMCNRMKYKHSVNDFLAHVKKIASFQRLRSKNSR